MILAVNEGAIAILAGAIGPIAAATLSWRSIARAYRRDPASVTRVMIAGFAAKMVFFGGYVVVVLRVLGVRPMPFVASFTACFIGSYLIEALLLNRLFRSG